MTSTIAWRVTRRSGCLIGQLFQVCGQWRLEQIFHGRRFLHWRTMIFNYNNNRHYHHVVNRIQCTSIPSLDCNSIFRETQCSPHHTVFKAVRCNLVAPLLEHISKWKTILHMDGYYVVGVIAIPYPRSGCIVSILSEEKAYLMSIADIPHCTCLDFAKMLSMAMEKGRWVTYKHLYYVFMYLCKVDYA